MNDQEICDLIGVPEDKRPEVLAYLHAWSKDYMPGPNTYAMKAVQIWAMMQRPDWEQLCT